MLRISRTSMEGRTTLTLEGQINGRWVEELRSECDRSLQNVEGDRKVVLDLANVSSIDATGLDLLKELTTRHVTMENCSPYVAELLRDVIDADG